MSTPPPPPLPGIPFLRPHQLPQDFRNTAIKQHRGSRHAFISVSFHKDHTRKKINTGAAAHRERGITAAGENGRSSARMRVEKAVANLSYKDIPRTYEKHIMDHVHENKTKIVRKRARAKVPHRTHLVLPQQPFKPSSTPAALKGALLRKKKKKTGRGVLRKQKVKSYDMRFYFWCLFGKRWGGFDTPYLRSGSDSPFLCMFLYMTKKITPVWKGMRDQWSND